MASVERMGNKFRVVWRKHGKKQRRSFETQKEAESYAHLLGRSPGALISLPKMFEKQLGGPTVAEFARGLTEMNPDLGQSSKDIYRKALRRVSGTALGDKALRVVTPTDVREFVGALDADHRNVLQLLAKTFNAAVNEGVIQVSPMKRAKVKRPKQRQKDLQPLTVAEVERLAIAAARVSEQDALCIRIGAYAGLRGGTPFSSCSPASSK